MGPIRIWVGVGIQYWPLLTLPMAALGFPLGASTSLSNDKEDEEEEILEIISVSVGLGSPIWSFTATASASRSIPFLLPSPWISSKEVQGESPSFRSSKGRASLRGGDGGGGELTEIWFRWKRNWCKG